MQNPLCRAWAKRGFTFELGDLRAFGCVFFAKGCEAPNQIGLRMSHFEGTIILHNFASFGLDLIHFNWRMTGEDWHMDKEFFQYPTQIHNTSEHSCKGLVVPNLPNSDYSGAENIHSRNETQNTTNSRLPRFHGFCSRSLFASNFHPPVQNPMVDMCDVCVAPQGPQRLGSGPGDQPSPTKSSKWKGSEPRKPVSL